MAKVAARIRDRRRSPTIQELLTLYESDGITPDYLKEEGAISEVPPEFYPRLAELHQQGRQAKQAAPDLEGIPGTNPLYYQDDPRQFDAVVVRATKDMVILDRTAFYPRGGGQEPDTGIIGGCSVRDVQKHGEVIIHYVDGPLPEAGRTVRCQVNADRRYRITKNHTATHILNASSRMVLGSWVWQHSAHKDEDHARLDVTHHSALTAQEISRIQDTANGIVRQDLQVTIQYMDRGSAESRYGFSIYQGGVVPVRSVRIVSIGEIDVEACGGTHVTRTGQVERIRITRAKRIQDGVVRIEFVAGAEAASAIQDDKAEAGGDDDDTIKEERRQRAKMALESLLEPRPHRPGVGRAGHHLRGRILRGARRRLRRALPYPAGQKADRPPPGSILLRDIPERSGRPSDGLLWGRVAPSGRQDSGDHLGDAGGESRRQRVVRAGRGPQRLGDGAGGILGDIGDDAKMTINWGEIERKWQDIWEERRLFEANPDGRPKKMITVAYPYPNSPQHIGHGRTYTLADIDARFWRMRGYNVLFPMGFHYTGTPILGMARRVQGKDAELLAGLRDIFGVPQEAIAGFTEPLNIANYFRDEIRQGMKEMGYSIDWRRQFTTIDEPYRRFIEWQISSLKEAGLIIQGSHPVGWCPEDQNPVSQHDTLGDVEPEFTEYILVKFRWSKYVIPTATLRPETVFGVTNVWVNPEVTYDIVKVGDEQWVVSPQCAGKLSHQGKDPVKVGTIQGSELAGESLGTPLGGMVPMLAAGFADPETGTGLVMSVPAHAPFDYAALRDAASKSEAARAITPVPIISVPGFGRVPAQEICEEMGIDDQLDERLEEATTQIYNKEFYEGVLTEGCGRFAGQKVSECKDAVREWLREANGAEAFHELAGEVRCRCGARCVVKMLTNQWFLNYGDDRWKSDTRSCLGEMSILPPEISGEFYNVVDWLRERACARQHGLGTKLPWDENWIVESLSDSTIYMAFYVIMRFIRDGDHHPGDDD